MPTAFPFTNTPPSPTSTPTPKLHLTAGALPSYITPTSPPLSKPPFQQIHSVPFPSTTTLLLPSPLAKTLLPHLPTTSAATNPRPFRLQTPLNSLLTPPLLTHIQTPSSTHLTLLSAGAPGVDDTFSLHKGVLTLNLAKELYERTGLKGRAVRSGARKHGKGVERFVVEVDLRSGEMREGRKGWKRVRRAVAGVLGGDGGGGREWVGVLSGDTGGNGNGNADGDGGGGGDGGLGKVLVEMGAEWGSGEAGEGVSLGVRVPRSLLTGAGREVVGGKVYGGGDEEDIWGLLEWVDLMALGSERAREGHAVNEFVCRYQVPGEEEDVVVGDVTVLKWTGMQSERWISDLLVELVKTSRVQKTGKDDWAVLSVTGHRTEAVGNIDGYRIFLQPARDDGSVTTGHTGPSGSPLGAHDKAVSAQGGDAMEIDFDTSHDWTPRPGFQRFVCMQFVDSVQT